MDFFLQISGDHGMDDSAILVAELEDALLAENPGAASVRSVDGMESSSSVSGNAHEINTPGSVAVTTGSAGNQQMAWHWLIDYSIACLIDCLIDLIVGFYYIH